MWYLTATSVGLLAGWVWGRRFERWDRRRKEDAFHEALVQSIMAEAGRYRAITPVGEVDWEDPKNWGNA